METIKFQVEFLVDEINRENSTEIQRRYLTSQSLAALKKAAEEFKERNRFVRDIKIKRVI